MTLLNAARLALEALRDRFPTVDPFVVADLYAIEKYLDAPPEFAGGFDPISRALFPGAGSIGAVTVTVPWSPTVGLPAYAFIPGARPQSGCVYAGIVVRISEFLIDLDIGDPDDPVPVPPANVYGSPEDAADAACSYLSTFPKTGATS